jgi:hypothetical protein
VSFVLQESLRPQLSMLVKGWRRQAADSAQFTATILVM